MIRVSDHIEKLLREAITAAQEAGDLNPFDPPPALPVTRPRNPEHGDYATPAAMQLAKHARSAPPKIAAAIADHLPESEVIGAVEVAGGFINFRLSEDWLRAQVDAILRDGGTYANTIEFTGQTAQVECVSANPTGPIHLGRIRGGIMGDVFARLLHTRGYDVELEYYYNNGGKQMDLLAESIRARYLEKLGKEAQFPAKGYKGDYIYDLAQALIDDHGEALGESDDLEVFRAFGEQAISAEQARSLARVNITFDSYFNENTLYGEPVEAVLEALDERGLTYKAVEPRRADEEEASPRSGENSGEATCLKMMDLREDATQDVVIVRSDGSPTYRLPDVAYHVDKFERGYELMVNVLGADHIEEAKDVKATMGALGYDANKLQHIIHQFVHVIKDGEQISGSTRAGDFFALDDLVDMVAEETSEAFAVDVVRYFILARGPNTHLNFDVDLALSQSNENPVFYIQNAHVRCAGIARQAEEAGLDADKGDVNLLTDEAELRLVRKMVEMPEVIYLATEELEPHRIAYWAHEELAATFHPIYDEVRAIHGEVAEDKTLARLKLYAAARVIFARVLELMGMTAPERM